MNSKMGIGAILLFAFFSVELHHVVHGADLQQISGKTANNFDGNQTFNQGENNLNSWLERIQQDAITNNVAQSSTNFYNELPNEGVTKVITVAKTGVADFRRLQDAVDSVPEDNMQRVVIYIQSGIYKEKVLVPKTKPYITFQGQGKRATVITWNDDLTTLDKFGKALGTMKSASVTIESDYFVAANLSFQNNAVSPNLRNKYRQAVALRISGDMAMFLSCGFFGHQDTLCDDAGRHYFYNCTIKGTVDYIFGNGRSLYERCAIRSLERFGAITAQGRGDPSQLTGFAFVRCRIAGYGGPYLGRAWGDFSRVVYINSKFNVDIGPHAWSDFGHPGRRSTSFYGMYRCRGPAVKSALKSRWTRELTSAEAKPFLDKSFINSDSWFQPYAKLTLDPMKFATDKASFN